MRNLLFEVSATDPLTFIAIVLLLIAVALLACWIPARRATKVDPLKIEIFPESERDYFARIMEFWMSFETGSQDLATVLIIRPGSMNIRAKRIEAK
ncbi:MAG: hypothetical protein ACREEM_03960 [Blastocatellia bacterium]